MFTAQNSKLAHWPPYSGWCSFLLLVALCPSITMQEVLVPVWTFIVGRSHGSCRQMCICCDLTHFLLSPTHLENSVALPSTGHLAVPNTPPSLPPTRPPPLPRPSHICWQKGVEAGCEILAHQFSSTALL